MTQTTPAPLFFNRCNRRCRTHGNPEYPTRRGNTRLYGSRHTGGLKGITVEQARELGCGIILGNTYHLLLRPGPEVVHQLGGLQESSGWRGPMLTDSGGYQVFSLASMRQIDEEGVRFKSHLDGSKLLMTAESRHSALFGRGYHYGF